jgi:hypothetical protein
MVNSPRAGQTLLDHIRPIAERVHAAHASCSLSLRTRMAELECADRYASAYGFGKIGLSRKVDRFDVFDLAASAVVLNWLVAVSSGGISRTANLCDAEKWFHGSEEGHLTSELARGDNEDICRIFQSVHLDDNFLEVLPYAVEVFETRGEIISKTGRNRRHKRARGIFYTPGDLAQWIVREVVRQQEAIDVEKRCWLDPACGTGSLLRAVQVHLLEKGAFTIGSSCFDYSAHNLYGIDSSHSAIQSISYLLTIFAIKNHKNFTSQPVNYVRRLSENFIVADALRVSNGELSSLFPGTNGRFDFVISNPPYIKSSSSPSNRIQLVPSFINLLARLSKPGQSAGAMVGPLSITHSTRKEYKDLRKSMWSANSWTLCNFDRTPDSLFGDDVKTRNTVVFFRNTANSESISSTELMRWSSRTRNELFDNVKTTKVPVEFRDSVIPKCSDEIGFRMLTLLYSDADRHSISDVLRRVETGRLPTTARWLLKNQPTAYNWLPFSVHESKDRRDPDARYWTGVDERACFSTFAYLNSALTYWLWRVWADGFHLTDRFIKDLPLDLRISGNQRLADLGAELWKEMQNTPIETSNAGVRSVTYSPLGSGELLDEIDSFVLDTFGLPEESKNYLRDFIHRTIVAGRDRELETNRNLRTWNKRENRYAASNA